MYSYCVEPLAIKYENPIPKSYVAKSAALIREYVIMLVFIAWKNLVSIARDIIAERENVAALTIIMTANHNSAG